MTSFSRRWTCFGFVIRCRVCSIERRSGHESSATGAVTWAGHAPLSHLQPPLIYRYQATQHIPESTLDFISCAQLVLPFRSWTNCWVCTRVQFSIRRNLTCCSVTIAITCHARQARAAASQTRAASLLCSRLRCDTCALTFTTPVNGKPHVSFGVNLTTIFLLVATALTKTVTRLTTTPLSTQAKSAPANY